MGAGYDNNDDAAAFTPSGNGNASKAVLTGSIDDELLSKVLPRVDTNAIEEARITIGQEFDDSDLQRPLSQSSVLARGESSNRAA
ncbi:uncharacterized protein ColSpa_06781 [Colletotrichum spaethianum]|uniref:Uncharacterized protein n=1 Tax=Colletotrichum spaethianum TaxID=700344 RepID=A0AA37LIJ5_9PEZI|nr:uncharacterized protein ColSpa_06781 [Colletotrichum spaethianum]GKT46600.1 hypothetical protein ColSpa_06781 [Colletotrichum spaethianum]